LSEAEKESEREHPAEIVPNIKMDPLELMCKIASIEKHGNRSIMLSYMNEDDPIVSTIKKFASAWFEDDRAIEMWHCTRALEEFFASIEQNKDLLLNDVIIKTKRLYKSSGVRPIEGRNEYNKDISAVDGSKYLRTR
tara:strand:- start:8095 stop:8505 length:411 start_codon:yes stop_codon:yes gene_type:complete